MGMADHNCGYAAKVFNLALEMRVVYQGNSIEEYVAAFTCFRQRPLQYLQRRD